MELQELQPGMPAPDGQRVSTTRVGNGVVTASESPSHHAPISFNSISSERLVYFPREWKCPLFRGDRGLVLMNW